MAKTLPLCNVRVNVLKYQIWVVFAYFLQISFQKWPYVLYYILILSHCFSPIATSFTSSFVSCSWFALHIPATPDDYRMATGSLPDTTGSPPDYYWITARSLPDHYRITAGYYRITAGLLLDYCQVTAGSLPDHYRITAGTGMVCFLFL